MSAPDDPLDTLLSSVSEGLAVDWQAESERPGSTLERSQIDALRDVARIVEFNRALQRSPSGSKSPLAAAAAGTRRWGSLLLLEQVGAGASGEVYRAWDPTLEREVALKLMRPGLAGNDHPLLEEARALARLRHPEVVSVYGIGEEAGQIGLWMEFLRGEDLAQRIERMGPLPAAEVVRIGVAISRALTAVHAGGLLHRDIKPANVVLTEEHRVVLTDFGLGQRRALQDDDPLRISGTPMFMAPERLSGESATTRSDLYALGVTLWCALTGRPPFTARTMGELREQSSAGAKRSLHEERPDLPAGLIATIECAMAASPEARFANAEEMGTALEMALVPPRVEPSPVRMLLTVAAAAAMVFAGWLVLRQPAKAPAPIPAATSVSTALPTFDLEASIVRRNDGQRARLSTGDRVGPGDQLALEFRATRPAHVYLLNEDERGESYLLFPQPLFELQNPLPADTTLLLPGTMGGDVSAWTVTSRGGREHFLVIASLEPVSELEAELARLPAPTPGRAPRYAMIPAASVERLRGVGGVSAVPSDAAPQRAGTFDRFHSLAGRERDVRGVWVRQVTLENPVR